ncbi:hypothetical protein KTE66_26660 [Burkholderia multivorans]|nr:hypothetical protein [Burkholderia multivorans]
MLHLIIDSAVRSVFDISPIQTNMITEPISLHLYKTNREFQLRIARLLQESGRQWFEAVERATADSIAESAAEIETLRGKTDWPSVAALPAESLGRLFQRRADDAQAVAREAVKSQAAFTAGLQQALGDWQKAVGEVAGGVNAASSAQDFIKQWSGAWQGATAVANAKVRKEA